jgi:hypothetical protein
MQSIPVGAKGSFSLVVMPDHLASRFKDVTLPPVLATPVMIMVMENAALNAIKPYLDAASAKRKSPKSMGGASSFRFVRPTGMRRLGWAHTNAWCYSCRNYTNG